MIRSVLSSAIFAQVFISVLSLSLKSDITATSDNITQTLILDNPYHNSGSWGNIEQCENGSYVSAFEIRYLAPGNLDETAINAIKLYCTDYVTKRDTSYITSSTGSQGDWWGMVVCTEDFFTGFRANTLQYQGTFTDDVAVENIEAYCNDGQEVLHGIPIHVPRVVDLYDFREGDWSSFANCDVGRAVCGIKGSEGQYNISSRECYNFKGSHYAVL